MKTLFPFYFSSSVMESTSCKMKFFRQYCQKLQGVGTSPHLQAGGLLANALEMTRKAFYNDGLSEEEAIALGFDHILAATLVQHETKNNVSLAFAFKRYFKTFPLGGKYQPAELADGTKAIEYRFELGLGISHPDFPEKELIFTGKLDFLGSYEDYEGKQVLFVEDDKTTGRLFRIPGTKEVDIQKEEENYLTRGQFFGYHYAAHAIGIKTTKTLVRRIPLLKDPEAPFELWLPVSEFAIKNWFLSFSSEVEELKERYLHYKRKGDEFHSFPACYGDTCNAFFTPCPYKVGCMIPEGEEQLRATCKQVIRYPEVALGEEKELEDYLETLQHAKSC